VTAAAPTIDRTPGFDVRWLGELMALAALYFLTARLGLVMAIPGGHVTPVWPPSGISLAAVLLRGRRVWPGIWLGSFAANFWDFYGGSLGLTTAVATSAIFGIGASLTALLGCQLLRRFVGERNPLERVLDVCAFMALGGVVSCLLSATVGVTTLCLSGFAPWPAYGETWLTWWLGDTGGVFIVAPLLLVWGGTHQRNLAARWVELLGGFCLMIAVAYYVFCENTIVAFTGKPLTFVILIPFLVWAAVRFGRRGAAAAVGLIALLAVWGTIHETGPFNLGPRNEALLLLELFLGVMALTALCLAAMVTEHEHVAAARQRAVEELESHVRGRTSALAQSEAQARQHLVEAERARAALLSILEDQQQAEAALRESQARTRLLVKSSNIGLWDWNLVTNEVFFSPEWKRQLGWADDELPNHYEEWESRLHPEDREPTLRAVQDFHEGRRADYDVEFRLRHKDGSWRWILTRADLIRDAAGQPVRMMGCHIDISARKQAEEKLRESETRFRLMFEKSGVGMVLSTVDSIYILQANAAFCALLGRTEEEVIGHSTAEFTHPEDVAKTLRPDTEVREDGVHIIDLEKRYVRKDGATLWAHVTAVLHFDENAQPLYYIAIVEDITDRKRAEDALRESEERFRAIFEQAPLGISEGEIATARFISANQRYVDILGYTVEELRKLTFKDYSHPEDLQKDLAEFQKLAAGEIRNYAMEKRYLRKDGVIIWVNLTVSGLARPGEKPLTCIAVIDDITDRIRAEEALNAQGLRYKTLMETSTDSIYVLDEEGDLREANAAFLRHCGYTAEEVTGFNVADWEARWTREQLQLRLRKLAGGGDAVFETRHRCKDGSIFDVEVCATSAQIGGEQLFVCVTRDITQRKRAADELERANYQLRFLSRRMFEIQEEERRHLARELHDEIGQALTAAKINLQSIPAHGDKATLERLQETTALLDSLLGQVRKISLDLRPSMLDDLGLVPALRSLVDQQSRRAAVTVRFSSEEVPDDLDPEIQTTCFRIAQETITNVLRHAHATHLDVDLRRQDGNLALVIHDDGIGFDVPSTQTQAVGLGLIGINERAALVGGRASIKSSPNNGTTIEVFLPLIFPPKILPGSTRK